MKSLAPTVRMSTLVALALLMFGGAQATFAQGDARRQLTISSNVADITTLDPHRATALGGKGVVSSMFDALVRFPPGSADPKALQPDLADQWEASPDNKTWTFRLRKAVMFHGGYDELKAADLVYSIQRASDPKRSSFAADLTILDKVEALDDYTVRIKLKYSDATFLGQCPIITAATS